MLSGDNMDDVRLNIGSHVPSVSEARLSSILDTAVDGIVVMDGVGRIMVYNHACERLFGYGSEEAIGQNIRMLMPPEYSDHHDRFVESYHDTGIKRIIGIGREVKGRRKDGEVFPIELSVGEAETPDGRQFVGVMRDLRSRKESEQRMSELQGNLIHMTRVSAMDEMGAALAHELNQPLTAIMLYLQAASRARPDVLPEATRIILGKAVREAERAGSIIQRMRQFVEKREPERKPHDLRKLVDEAVELALLGNRNPPRLVREYVRDLPEVAVDPVQIQQIVVNLMRNSIEALKGRAGAQIRLAIRPVDNTVMFAVSDSGPGIPEEIMPTLFKAFSTSKRTGLGLGLAISKTIAQNHGGDLSVEPGGKGLGATFVLQLPAPAAERT